MPLWLQNATSTGALYFKASSLLNESHDLGAIFVAHASANGIAGPDTMTEKVIPRAKVGSPLAGQSIRRITRGACVQTWRHQSLSLSQVLARRNKMTFMLERVLGSRLATLAEGFYS